MLRVDRNPAAARASAGLGAVLAGAVLFAACSETTHEPLTVEVAKITIEAEQLSIREGGTTQLVASVQSRYGYELERQVAWSSSSPELATVDAKGLVTGVHGGYPEITAMAEGMRASILITVEEYPKTLEVAQVPAMEIGDIVGPVATVRCGQGHPMDVPLTWTTANPQVAQVDANGQVLAVGPGQTTITAQGAGLTQAISVSVKEQAAWLMLEAPSTFMRIGQEAQVTAVARGTAMNVVNRAITWTSSAPGVVSVTAEGAIKALSPGPATITAYSDGAVGFVGIVVEEPVGMVWVTRDLAPVRPNSTVQFGVETRTGAGALVVGREVNWSTSDPSIATVDANGKLTTHAPGTVDVYTESEGVITTSVVMVEGWIATLALNPPALVLPQGAITMIVATARDADESVVHPAITWTSSDPVALSVSARGGVAAMEAGDYTITAAAEGVSITIDVTVIAVQTVVLCNEIELDHEWIEMRAGTTHQLTATAYDEYGAEIVRPLEWSSDDEGTAKVEDGLVTAVEKGITKVTVTCDGETAEVGIEVLPRRGPATWIQVNDIVVVFVGEPASVDAVAYDRYGPMSIKPALRTTTPDVIQIVEGQIVGLHPGAGWVWVCCDELAVPIRVIVKQKGDGGG